MSEMNLVQASQFVPSMFMAQDPQMPSRQERRKVSVESTLFLIQNERVENHRAAIVEIDLEGIDMRAASRIRVVSIDLERLDARCAGRDRPGLPAINPQFFRDPKVRRYWKSFEQPIA